MEKKRRIEYDKTWKEVVTHLINPFVEFFLPDLYQEIDWSFEPQFLEKELQNPKNITKPKRIADKLVKVKLKNGEEKWIYIHIEFQTDGSIEIGVRMFDYYQYIRERYGKEIVAIVIYTGTKVPKQPNIYKQHYFGTTITYEYNSYVVNKQKEEELLANQNPFAIVVLANLYVLQSLNDDEKRYVLKEKVFEIAKNRGYNLDDTIKLFIFAKELMKLPAELEQKFEKEVLSSTKNNSDMIRVSQSTKDYVNRIAKDIFGETVEQLQLSEKKLRKEKAKAEKELKLEIAKTEKEKMQIKAEADQKIMKSIVLLYTRVGMSIAEIAEELGYSDRTIKDILIERKVLEA